MDFSKLKPVKLDEKNAETLENKLRNQVTRVVVPTSVDDVISMWRTPVNDRALVYIPNFTRKNADGEPELDTEKAFIHSVRTASGYRQMRATTGLTGLSEVGISGDDPLHEVEQKNWEIYNFRLDRKAAKLNADKGSDALQETRRNLLNDFSVRPANEYYYFPIIKIETEMEAGKDTHSTRKIVKGEDGKPSVEVYLFRISANWYQTKLLSLLDSMPEGATLAGQLYNFSYITGKKTADLKNPSRDSGLAFNPVIMNGMADSLDEGALKWLDDQASKFTPQFLRENVYDLMLLPDDVHQELADEAMDVIKNEYDSMKMQESAEEIGGGDTAEIGEGTAAEKAMAQLGSGSADGSKPTEEGATGDLDFGTSE